jgi:L-fuculose-phosphate aldolase
MSDGPNTMSEVEKSLERVADACRMLSMEGHGDITLGHLSFRDPKGRGLWLKKSQRGLDEVRQFDDFVLIDFEGRQLENVGNCHSEWPIHSEIMKARPDVHVVGHTHAHYSVLFSAAEEALCALNHEGANLISSLARFRLTAGLINTQALGQALAQSLGSAAVVLMKNHGVTFVGGTLEEATLNGIFIERACRAQIEMASTGWNWTTPSDIGHDRKMQSSDDPNKNHYRIFFDYFHRKLKRSERAVA